MCSGYGRETGRQALTRGAAHHIHPISRCWVIAPLEEGVELVLDAVAFARAVKVGSALRSFREVSDSRAAKATGLVVEMAGTGLDAGKLVELVA